MSNEERLFEALQAVMPAYHLAMDGEPEEAAVYSLASRNFEYESGEPILQRDTYSIIVAQRNHKHERVEAVRNALAEARFFVRFTAQSMASNFDAGYSIDTLTASCTTSI